MRKWLMAIGAMAVLGTKPVQAHGIDSPFFTREGGFTMEIPWLEEQYEKLVAKHGYPESQPLIRSKKAVEIGERQTFWAMNVAVNSPVQVEATLRHVGKHCYIYLEVDEEGRVSQETIEELARKFDDEIYATNHKFFGSENNPGVDFDERITLLFLDIQDGWEPGKGYVAGYFSPMDQYPTSMWQFSNEREIFYMDINPADPTRRDYLGILAHEFQHMIHYNYDKKEELFLNEAMSQISFWANDFGHAPQILSFIQKPDTQINEFNNGIDDYGNVYLFMYYLATKVLGGKEQAAPVFREIVQNPDNGLPTIEKALKNAGVEKPLSEIMMDFLIANYVNDESLLDGRYGYDLSLPMKVQPSYVNDFRQSAGQIIEESVNENAADFLYFARKVVSEPVNATLVDKIRIYSDHPGQIRWNLNDGTLPPEVWHPAGSQVDGQEIITPTQTAEGRHFIEVGPFVRGGVQVTRVNFEAISEFSETRGQIPVYSFQTKSRPAESLTLQFNGEHKGFFGKERKFALKLFKTMSDGSKSLEDVVLDKKNDATITVDLANLESFTLIPVSTLGGELEYSLTIHDTNNMPRGVLAEWMLNEDDFLTRLLQEPELMEQFSREWKNLDEDSQRFHGLRMRTFMRRFQFELMDQKAGMQGAASALKALQSVPLNPSRKADDSDTSHDNLEFLIKKAREGEHALSHLKIDPKFIEGQILSMYKLLEIAQGFPHLPLPDGFAIVDYKTDGLKALLSDWEQNGNEQHFEPLRRLALAESVIVSTYDEGLTMAEDASLSLLDLTSFFLQSKTAISRLLNPVIAKGGLVGELADGLKKRIHAKIVQILSRVVALVSAKLPSPYNTIVPIASSVIQVVWAKVFKLELESDRKWMKPFVAKTLGKYALMSVPGIGIVAKGNPNVDYTAQKAASLQVSGTTHDAEDAIRQKMEPVLEAVGTVHARSVKEREYAQIARYITQLTGMTSLLDPTVISKVVGIVSTVTGTGLLVHSIWESSSTLYGIPEQVPGMVDEAFKPFGGNTAQNPALVKDSFAGLKRTSIDMTESRKRLEKANLEYIQIVENVLNTQNIVIIRELAAKEAEYSKALKAEELALLGNQGLEARDGVVEMIQAELKRSELDAEILNGNFDAARIKAREVMANEARLLQSIRSRSQILDIVPVVTGHLKEIQWQGRVFRATVEIESLGSFGEVEARFLCSDNIELSYPDASIDARVSTIVIEGMKKNLSEEEILMVSFETPEGVLQIPLNINL